MSLLLIIFACSNKKLMSRVCFSILLAAFLCPVYGQMKWNSSYQQYIDTYKDLAIEQMLKYGIPASITLAQGVYESGAGKSELARRGNNHFGIKCNGWSGRRQYHDDDKTNECFRAYDNAYESYEDHSRFLSNSSRYKHLFKLRMTDYKGWAKGLKAAGYATNRLYAHRLIDIIQLYRLHKYDKEKHFDRFIARHSSQNNGKSHHYRINAFNKNYYLIAREGDTFAAIGQEVGISPRRLARYNELPVDFRLSAGDIVYLKKKRSKVPAVYEDHIHYVKAGDSMYSIAQKYGIKLKALYKINRLPASYQPSVGDQLKLSR